MPTLPPAQRTTVAVASLWLPGARAEWPTEPLDPTSWAALHGDVRRHRLAGLLDVAIAQGRLPVTEEQAGQANNAVRDAMAMAVRLERLLLRVDDVLARAGVRHMVLKGPANAHLDYEDPLLRPFQDIDILIEDGRYTDGSRALVADGLRRRSVELRPGWDETFGKGTTLVAESGLEVDLHRLLVAGGFGFTLDLPELWDAPGTIELSGRTYPVLGRTQRFLHACYHAALGDEDPRLLTHRDVIQVMLQLSRQEQLQALALARSWKAEAVVGHAVRRAVRELAIEVDHPIARWAAAHQASKAELRLLAAYVDHPTFGAQAMASVRAVPGITRKARYVAALAFPAHDHLDARREDSVHRWKRGLSLLARRLFRAKSLR